MKFCSSCGTELTDDAAFCVKCGRPVASNQNTPQVAGNVIQNNAPNVNTPEVDAPSDGFGALSFFFPLVGLILFIVWSRSSPLKAKSCGVGALVGFIVSIIFGFAVWFFIYRIVTGAYNFFG